MTISLNLQSLLNGEDTEALEALIASSNPAISSLAKDIKSHTETKMHIIHSIDEMNNLRFGPELTEKEKKTAFNDVKRKFGNEKIINFSVVLEQAAIDAMYNRVFHFIDKNGNTMIIKNYEDTVHENFPEKGGVYGLYDSDLNEYFLSWDNDTKTAGMVAQLHDCDNSDKHINGAWAK